MKAPAWAPAYCRRPPWPWPWPACGAPAAPGSAARSGLAVWSAWTAAAGHRRRPELLQAGPAIVAAVGRRSVVLAAAATAPGSVSIAWWAASCRRVDEQRDEKLLEIRLDLPACSALDCQAAGRLLVWARRAPGPCTRAFMSRVVCTLVELRNAPQLRLKRECAIASKIYIHNKRWLLAFVGRSSPLSSSLSLTHALDCAVRLPARLPARARARPTGAKARKRRMNPILLIKNGGGPRGAPSGRKRGKRTNARSDQMAC